MKQDNPLVDGGVLALVLGAVAFVPPLLGREYLITAWLGDMEQPVGLSAMIVGGVLIAIGKLRDFRNGPPEISSANQIGVAGHAQADDAERETPPTA